MHTTFAFLGLIVLALTQFLYFATTFEIMVSIALTVTGKTCILVKDKEICKVPDNCDIFLCQFTSQLTLIGGLIFGIVLISTISNIIIHFITQKVSKTTLTILNTIDGFISLLPALISTMILITYLILPLIYTEWDFSIQLGLLLMVSTCCFFISYYLLLTRTINKRKPWQQKGENLIMSSISQV